MLLAVSPYHLTTREPPAMAALLLARRVVTLLPEPGGDDRRAAAEQSARELPRYLAFLKTWQWSMPLWSAGVIGAAADGDDASADVTDVCRRIAGDDRFAAIRPFIRHALYEDATEYLEAVATDLLKGGPDPALSIPIAAAMDRFAVRHRATVARSEAASIAQRAEERLGERVLSVGVPILLRAGGARLLEARAVLDKPLEALRHACVTTLDADDPGSGVRDAAHAYSDAFEAARGVLTRPEDEERVAAGTVVLEWRRLPVDAVLHSSVTAYRAATGDRVPPAGSSASSATGLVERDPLEGLNVNTVVVRVLGRARQGGHHAGADR